MWACTPIGTPSVHTAQTRTPGGKHQVWAKSGTLPEKLSPGYTICTRRQPQDLDFSSSEGRMARKMI